MFWYLGFVLLFFIIWSYCYKAKKISDYIFVLILSIIFPITICILLYMIIKRLPSKKINKQTKQGV